MTPAPTFGYSGGEGLSSQLLAAVLSGTKTATSSLAVEYLSGELLPGANPSNRSRGLPNGRTGSERSHRFDLVRPSGTHAKAPAAPARRPVQGGSPTRTPTLPGQLQPLVEPQPSQT